MKKITILLLLLCMTSPAWGKVSVKVCLSDGVTPLEPIEVNLPITKYPDIMVGTKLTIIIRSDVAKYWYGGALVLKEAEMANYGLVYGRDFDGFQYPGSCLPDAGEEAAVFDTYMYAGPGFEIYGGFDPNAGDWFIFDYNALDIGNCKIDLHDFDAKPELVQTLSFNHVRTRDFNNDTKVDFSDYAILASHWLKTDCSAPGWCQGADLDTDGNIDYNDLRLFCEYWLEKTE